MQYAQLTPLYEEIQIASNPFVGLNYSLFLGIIFFIGWMVLKKKYVLGSIGLIVSIILFCGSVYLTMQPEISSEARFDAATISATNAIKDKVKEEYKINIIEENLFEKQTIPDSSFRSRTRTIIAVKQFPSMTDQNGNKILASLKVSDDRTEVLIFKSLESNPNLSKKQ